MTPKPIKPTNASLPKSPVPAPMLPTPHADGSTTRPETPALEGREPLPAELTGRASGTDDDLVALFRSGSDEHLTDGFRGGSEDVPGSGEVVLNEDEALQEKPPE